MSATQACSHCKSIVGEQYVVGQFSGIYCSRKCRVMMAYVTRCVNCHKGLEEEDLDEAEVYCIDCCAETVTKKKEEEEKKKKEDTPLPSKMSLFAADCWGMCSVCDHSGPLISKDDGCCIGCFRIGRDLLKDEEVEKKKKEENCSNCGTGLEDYYVGLISQPKRKYCGEGCCYTSDEDVSEPKKKRNVKN